MLAVTPLYRTLSIIKSFQHTIEKALKKNSGTYSFTHPSFKVFSFLLFFPFHFFHSFYSFILSLLFFYIFLFIFFLSLILFILHLTPRWACEGKAHLQVTSPHRRYSCTIHQGVVHLPAVLFERADNTWLCNTCRLEHTCGGDEEALIDFPVHPADSTRNVGQRYVQDLTCIVDSGDIYLPGLSGQWVHTDRSLPLDKCADFQYFSFSLSQGNRYDLFFSPLKDFEIINIRLFRETKQKILSLSFKIRTKKMLIHAPQPLDVWYSFKVSVRWMEVKLINNKINK